MQVDKGDLTADYQDTPNVLFDDRYGPFQGFSSRCRVAVFFGLGLRRLGFTFDRNARGSHEIWWNPVTRHRTTIPNHSGDLPEGTVSAILKRAGVTAEDFLRA
ncbi:MAG: type II toxin-antitoxin system HicA family toxin [Candidatus Latescibacteria bacterium]|nr:type II toxin-antitoxin system HicA family toxin [Candidatus Latescibacterota bacterium]